MFEIMNISELYHSITQKYDLFICFNSFEKRCVSIASHLPIDKFAAALILTNKVHFENEEENLQKLSSLFSEKGTVVQLDLSSPVDIADKIIEQLNEKIFSLEKKRVFVDITTFTHESLLILFAIFKEKYSEAEIICGYNNAKAYSSDKTDIESKWLSRGIGEVRSVLGYPGNLKPSQDNLLMVIVGYEFERAARIIDAISPDYLSIGYNIENNATTEKDRDANMGYARLLKEMAAYFEQTTDFVVPSNNPYAAFKAMQEKLDAIGDKINVTIVPMNNKLSTLGVALIGLANPEIQICYAPALIYNTSSYSIPGDSCYLFSFEFPIKAKDCLEEVHDENNQSII